MKCQLTQTLFLLAQKKRAKIFLCQVKATFKLITSSLNLALGKIMVVL